MQKIGIIGGTFNPIHNGHLILAERAYWEYNLDKVIFIPAKVPPHKADMKITDASLRYEMTSLAIKDNPHFEVSDIELNLQGYSYTSQTLQLIHERYPEDKLYFIMGEDSLEDFSKWNRPDIICSLVTILVAGRDSDSTITVKQLIEHYRQMFNADIHILDTPEIMISSTAIREIIKDGASVRYCVPDTVIDFIDRNHLYDQ